LVVNTGVPAHRQGVAGFAFTKVIRLELKFTHVALAVLLGSLLLGGLVVAGAALAQPPDPGTEPPPLAAQGAIAGGEAGTVDALSASEVVSSAISYQGRLTDNGGNPLDGTYDMEFQFWDDESAGNQVGGTIARSNVDVDEGLFNVRLEVDAADFNGQELWLRVRVREHGGTWDDWMTPRQEIQPVPYALSLRPGAVISDTSSYVELNRYYVQTWPIQRSTKYGVYARAEGAGKWRSSVGLYGSGDGTGVIGFSEAGRGVYGGSTTGTAIYGSGDVKQSLTGNGLVKAAVYAYCSDSPTLVEIHRSFNNVSAAEITIANGSSQGRCTIDLGFDVSDRFWVTTAPVTIPRIVGCYPSSDTELSCYRFNQDGTSANGDIMLLVY
jgi:hypothetical protein